MTKRMARMAVLTALALGLAALERLLPLPVTVPGVKLGLANLATLAALYLLDLRAALIVGTARVLLGGFLFGSAASVLYALSGALCAAFVMGALRRCGGFSVVGVSVAGGVAHNAAQILVAAAVVHTVELIYYLPILVLSGVVTGLLNGLIAAAILPRVQRALDARPGGGGTPGLRAPGPRPRD